jgi:chemotaxis protein methyltransferase CheR
MQHEQRVRALEQTLSFWGLDVGRYTSVLAESFLARWPNLDDWRSAEARSALISTFAIGETTFMRHPEQFAALRSLLPGLAIQHTGPLRVWSAGCASGEEAYSLAASLTAVGISSFELSAWDLNPEAIARARLGEYRPWSLRGVDAGATEGWLEPSPCGVRVAPWLRERVRFDVANLFADAFPTNLDLIFCRNVLLYFRPEAASRVLCAFAESLRPGGVLFLGYYDPRPTLIPGLVRETHGEIVYYRKTESDGLVVIPRPRVSVRPPSPEKLVPSASDAQVQAASTPEARMERVRLLVNQRRMPQALSLLEELSTLTPLLPDVHVLTALVAEDAGDMRLMLQAARRACFLVPEHPGPNYFLSVAFARNGELRRAALHRRIAAASVRKAHRLSAVLEHSEGLTVGQLRRLIGAIAR